MKTLQRLMTEYAELKKERDELITRNSEYTPNQLLDHEANTVLRREHETRWTKFYTDKYEPQLQELRDEGRDVAARIKAEGDRKRPKLDNESPAALMRTEQAWRGTVLPLIEKGVPLREALRNADVDAVLGAERFAPAYYAAQNHTSGSIADMEATLDAQSNLTLRTPRPDDSSNIHNQILERFAEMDPVNADTLRMAARADLDLGSFNRYVVEHDRGNGLDAALTRYYAAQGTDEAQDISGHERSAQEHADAVETHYSEA